MGGCSKTLKFVITIITWWVGVTKKCNCPLLFVTNLWCSHFFLHKRNFSTSQAKKKELLFFKPKVCLFLDNCETKKCFYCLAQQHCCLDKKKKKHLTLFVCFLFPSFWNWEKKKNSEKDKTKKRFFFSKGKCSLFCFWPWANFASNKMSRVLAFKSKLCRERPVFFFFLWTKRVNTCFLKKKFSEKFFLFRGQSIFDTNLLEKRDLLFFLWQKPKVLLWQVFQNCFLFFFHRCSTLATSLKVSTEFSTKKHQPKLLMITMWVGVWKTIILALRTLLGGWVSKKN